MNLDSLEQRIAAGEDVHTEFKLWPVNNVSAAESLVAFANTDGGQFIIGVSDDGQMVGVNDPDRVMQWFDNLAYHNCEPPLTVLQEAVRTTDGRTVIVVNVAKGDQRPYRTNRGDYVIRTTSGWRLATRQELLRLFQASDSLYYDETIVLRAALHDIDASLVEHFVERAYSQKLTDLPFDHETFLKNINLLRPGRDAFYPTVACMLFFGRNPQRYMPHAQVAVARIPGFDLSQPPSDAKQIDGTLLDQLEDTGRFLRVHLPTVHRIEGFGNERFPEIPEEALREIVVNALAHRDYTVAAPVRVFIYDNRVEVRTPGGLPNTVTIEAIKLGAAHVMRNPAVYTLFTRWGLVTGIGSGVYRAIRSITEATGSAPVLLQEGNEFVFLIQRPVQNSVGAA